MPSVMSWTSFAAWRAPSSERAFGVARVCALGCGLVTENEEIFSDGYKYQSNKKRGDSPKRRTLSDAPEDMPTPVEPGGDRPPDSANKNTSAKEAATEPATSKPVTTLAVNSTAPGTTNVKKRGRGRPPGSKNKKGTASAGVATPASNKRPRDVWVVESRKEISDRRHDYIEYKDIHGVFASLRAANVEARKIQAKKVDGTSEEDSGNMLDVEKIDSDDKPFYYSHLQETSEYDTETTTTIQVRQFPLR